MGECFSQINILHSLTSRERSYFGLKSHVFIYQFRPYHHSVGNFKAYHDLSYLPSQMHYYQLDTCNLMNISPMTCCWRTIQCLVLQWTRANIISSEGTEYFMLCIQNYGYIRNCISGTRCGCIFGQNTVHAYQHFCGPLVIHNKMLLNSFCSISDCHTLLRHFTISCKVHAQ